MQSLGQHHETRQIHSQQSRQERLQHRDILNKCFPMLHDLFRQASKQHLFPVFASSQKKIPLALHLSRSKTDEPTKFLGI